MKRVFFLQFVCKDGETIYYVVRKGRTYCVTLFPAKATLFDTFELACIAQKFMTDFSIKFVDICLK